MNHRRFTYITIFASKNQNPREGIETTDDLSVVRRAEWLQKTKIPARGLKHELLERTPVVFVNTSFKKPKSPRGD